VKSVYDENSVTFEMASNSTAKKCKGKVKLKIQAFAEALLVIPKALAQNNRYGIQEAIVNAKR
jgi:chaperonin GroEL (HSP60 family)